MGRQAPWVLVVVLAVACTAGRDRLRSGEAWADAAPIVYPAEPEALRTRLSKLLALWEFRSGPDAADSAVLNIYDRGEPVALSNLVGRVRIEPGPEPATTKVTAIGVRARGFGWDNRYRVDERVHEKLATFFHG
ncbi:MAG: hypothetical protein ACYTDU_04505 [Planctomycetota bacterium]|jgi:hypothetical protein